MSTHRFRLLLLAVLSCLALASMALAQSRVTISGTVKDSAGSQLQGALVQLDPGAKKAVTDDEGEYKITNVGPGDYTLTVSYVGFGLFQKSVKVDSDKPIQVDAVMEVASVSDQMFVRAERPQGEAEAINIQRTSDDVVQVLPSKVITSLPNTNIADAVGRLPSVTLERDEGEGKYVQIRGTEPRLSDVTINGVHVPSPEAGVRNIKLDAVPSDVVDRIEVFKTLSANQEGDAIGGSVNLVTKTAKDKPETTFMGQGGYTPIQYGTWLNAFSGTVGRRFGENRPLGLLLGVTYDHNDRGIDDLEPTPAIGNLNGQNFAFVNSEDRRTYWYNRSRYGADANVDYDIKPGFNVYLKGLYADFHDYGSVFVYTPNSGAPVSHNGSQTVFDNTGNMAYREYVRRPDQGVYSIAGGTNYAGSHTALSMQFAVSRGHNYGGQDFATTNFAGPQNVTFALDNSDPFRPKLNPIDGTNIFDPAAYTIANTDFPAYRSAEVDYEGTASLAQLYNVKTAASEFQMGVSVWDAHKTQSENDQFFNATGAFPMSNLLNGQSNPNYYDHSLAVGPFTNYPKIVNTVVANLQNGFTPDISRDRLVSDSATWDTHERVYGGYFLDSISLGRFRLQGGLRIEATSDDFRANRVNLNNGIYQSTTPVNGGGGYINLLPSVQAQFLLEKNTTLRLSYFRAISRPNFSDIVPSVQVDPNTTPKSLSLGNPSLTPTRAHNFDVLVEHYFQRLGVIEGGFFYKALANPIYPTGTFLPQSDPNFPGFLQQQSVNGPNAHIAGFETSWQERLSFLPGHLNGFGVAANYSYTSSRVTFPDGFSSAAAGGQGRIDHPSLQRQAPNTWNLGLTYDQWRFSMRFAVSHNDENIASYTYLHDPTVANVDQDPILGIKGPLGDQYFYAHTQFDIQGSYRLYKGLEFTVAGLNLTNEVFGFYQGSGIYPIQREYYHPTVIFGFRWVSALEQ